MSKVIDCVQIFSEIGTDRHLSQDEIPASDDVREFRQRAWQVYARCFDAYTGANIDPFFYRFDNSHVPSGRPVSQGRPAILVVGTGPSLQSGIPELVRLRSRILIFTSLRGAEALQGFGISPDLTILEHSGPLETELSARNSYLAEPKAYFEPASWIALEERTPPRLIEQLDNGRMFVPEGAGWGLWPATAVSFALQAGASKIGLLGIDLGVADAPDPAFSPLIEVLALLGSISPGLFWDCGHSGAVKPGWANASLPEFAAAQRPLPLQVTRAHRLTTNQRSQRCSRILESLKDRIDEARAGVCQARNARQQPSAAAAEGMRQWIERILGWKQNVKLRRQLQDDLALSFLPRFWRTGIDTSCGHRLWRPVLLVLNELVFLADRLQRKIGAQCRDKRTESLESGFASGREFPVQRGPSVVILPVTYACNARCQTCAIWRRRDATEFSIDTFRDLIRDPRVGDHLEVINLTGGEPFLRRDLAGFVHELLAGCPKLREIGIPTNGSMPERVLRFTTSMCDALPGKVTLAMTVSIDGGPVMHDSVRGVPGLFEKSMKTARMLVEEAKRRTNLTVGISMTVTPANVSQIAAVEKIADKHGVGLTLTPAVNSDIYIDAQAAQPFWSGQPAAWAEAAERLRTYARRRGIRHLEEASRTLEGAVRRWPCVFWDRGLFVDAGGSLLVCPVSSRGRFGSLQQEGGLGALWGTEVHREALDRLKSTECLRCVSNCMVSESDHSDVIRRAVQSRRPVLIFGAGAGGRKVYQHLESAGLKPQAFLDNAITEKGVHPYGIALLPWDGGTHCRGAFTVIASSTGAGDIARQLENEGFQNGRDFASYF